MKALLACLMIALTGTSAVAADQKPAPIFVPVGVYYVDGKLVNVRVFAVDEKTGEKQWFTDPAECADVVRHIVEGAVKQGHQMVGACLPVPSTAR